MLQYCVVVAKWHNIQPAAYGTARLIASALYVGVVLYTASHHPSPAVGMPCCFVTLVLAAVLQELCKLKESMECGGLRCLVFERLEPDLSSYMDQDHNQPLPLALVQVCATRLREEPETCVGC